MLNHTEPDASPPDSPPPSGPRPSAGLAALLDAWGALCAAAGRRSLSAASALTAGTPAHREAVALALVALGYPEAMQTPLTLGATLRSIRGRLESGRGMDISSSRGTSRWYVRPVAA